MMCDLTTHQRRLNAMCQAARWCMRSRVSSNFDLNLLAGDWTETDLIRWLDKELRQPDIRQT